MLLCQHQVEGPPELLPALASSVGTSCRVIGIHISPDQIEAANRACWPFEYAAAEVQDGPSDIWVLEHICLEVEGIAEIGDQSTHYLVKSSAAEACSSVMCSW